MTGKDKCKILKEIRQKIADENDIEYITRECTYQGECKGTCPRCEQELRYLEKELEKRKRTTTKIATVALAAGIAAVAAGCGPEPMPVATEGEAPVEDWSEDPGLDAAPADDFGDDVEVLTGEVDDAGYEDSDE